MYLLVVYVLFYCLNMSSGAFETKYKKHFLKGHYILQLNAKT